VKETDHRVERPAVVAPHPGARGSHIFAVKIDQLRFFFLPSKICISLSESVSETKVADKKHPSSLP